MSKVFNQYKRVGRMRYPKHVAVGVHKGKTVRFDPKISWKRYELAMADHDPADADLYLAAYMQLVTDTKEFRQGQRNRANVQRGKALCYKACWLKEHRDHVGHECLFFPSMAIGRPEQVKYNYKKMSAARAMLMMTQGLPQVEGAMATHKCGNGHLSCVNPAHLEWGTSRTNAKDAVLHNSPREFVSGLDRNVIEEIKSSPKLVNVIAWETGIPAAIVSGIKLGELYDG